MNDAELRGQLEQLHAASFGWALNCCARDHGQAEDVLQTTYLKVLSGRARFGGQAAFKTWLFAVIRRTAADERRRLWWRRLKLTAYGQELPVTVGFDDAPERVERQTLFRRALAALPARQREVLHLVFYQDLTVEAAAEVMGVSVGSARTHYARGKARFRTVLQQMEISHEHGLGRHETPAVV